MRSGGLLMAGLHVTPTPILHVALKKLHVANSLYILACDTQCDAHHTPA